MSDYDAACRKATTAQGLDPVIGALTAVGIPHSLEQTGGFTMVVTVPSRQPSMPGTYAITCDVVFLLGFYAGTTWQDGDHDEAVYSQFVTLESLIERIHRGPKAPLGWRLMFPGYEVPTEIEEIDDLRDVSDHRHACPCFADDSEVVKLWVEHPDAADRFAVTYWDDDDGNVSAYDGNDVHEALRTFVRVGQRRRGKLVETDKPTRSKVTVNTMQELARLIGQTFPNATTVPTVSIPWGDADAGLMVDYEDDAFRVGVYGDLATFEEPLALIHVDTANRAWAVLEHLTENQPDGTDWAAWAGHWCQEIWPEVKGDFS